MQSFVGDSQAVIDWIKDLGDKMPVLFPVKKGMNNYSWSRVNSNSDIGFDNYIPTIAPPGKRIIPASEELFRFSSMDGKVNVEKVMDDSKQVLAGIRPCDLKAINLMDLVMRDSVDDTNYNTRKDNTAIIMYRCPVVCDEKCFCESTGSLREERGADIVLTPGNMKILVEPKTEMGVKLISNKGLKKADDTDNIHQDYLDSQDKPFGRQLGTTIKNLPAVLDKKWTSVQWEKYVEKCFSCGTCNLVCPTCYCFSIKDDVEIGSASGSRKREADACMLPGFASVSGGHNFRKKAMERQRHRVNRKFKYLVEKYNRGSFCVGCGRCGRQCTASIDIFDIVNDIVSEGGQK